jgi:hypothetical protein
MRTCTIKSYYIRPSEGEKVSSVSHYDTNTWVHRHPHHIIIEKFLQ